MNVTDRVNGETSQFDQGSKAVVFVSIDQHGPCLSRAVAALAAQVLV